MQVTRAEGRALWSALCLMVAIMPWERATGQSWFQGIGYMPNGVVGSAAHAMSGDGQVVVGSGYWRLDSGMRSLGVLPGGTGANANAVSSDGAVVVGYADTQGISHGFVWTEAGIADIGSLGGPYTFAWGVSQDGKVAVGTSTTAAGPSHAFRLVFGQPMEDLGTLNNSGEGTTARAASADGSVVVGEALWAGGGNTRAIRWTATTGMQDMGSIYPNSTSAALAVSPDGSTIVGWSDSSPSLTTAFRWTEATGMVSLGLLPGAYQSQALAVSADGDTIVGYCTMLGGAEQAFVWTPSTGIESLREVLLALGVDVSGWQLRRATGVSADGKLICGNAVNPCQQPEGWFARYDGPIGCRSDLNHDGFLDGIDYDGFMNAFDVGSRLADYNGDCFTDGIDYDQFVNAFEAGC